MVVAEASVSEAGRLTLRAWEQTHVGDAHAVAAEVERLGLLAFCEPSEVSPLELPRSATERWRACRLQEMPHAVSCLLPLDGRADRPLVCAISVHKKEAVPGW